jgi:hypothetical protein
MKKYSTILIICVLWLSSCTKDVLDRTIFIPDENDRNLPAYTEWGYNSFGAVYDLRGYFLVSQSIVPCRIIYKDGRMRFVLNGYLSGDYYAENKNMTLEFSFPTGTLSRYNDLLMLSDKQINLLSSDCTVKQTISNKTDTLKLIQGNLYFKRVRKLFIDDVPNRIIVSGTFDLLFLEGDFPISISNGRFDMCINDNVFYVYENGN